MPRLEVPTKRVAQPGLGTLLAGSRPMVSPGGGVCIGSPQDEIRFPFLQMSKMERPDVLIVHI